MNGVNVCQFFMERKKRFCNMAVVGNTKFCPHHSFLDGEEISPKGSRIPCPFDPLHYCYSSKLEEHKKKCNARPRQQPAYYVENVNLDEKQASKEKMLVTRSCFSCSRKWKEHIVVFDIPLKDATHPCVEGGVQPIPYETSAKHFPQQASLTGLLEKHGLLSSGACFIEFGAGRGQLMYYIINNIQDKSGKHFILVDRNSFRYKRDNKFKENSELKIERLKIDIKNLFLGEVDAVKLNPDRIVGISKHLCGSANDVALRCMLETVRFKNENSGTETVSKPLGLVMSVCCHHRCCWRSYVGKEFFLENGFSERDFQIICILTSWAICGQKKVGGNEEKSHQKSQEDLSRYKKLGMKPEDREATGWKCKRLIDMGRIRYLKKHGLHSELVTYVSLSVSPENVAIIGLTKS